MGLYNIVDSAVAEVCAACSSSILRSVQFRFGDAWLHAYRVGDEIRWGGNDEGRPGMALVVADGYGEPCPSCRHLPTDARYEVWIRRDRIDSVRPFSGHFDFGADMSSFKVVDAG
jgi:hypothetical protein